MKRDTVGQGNIKKKRNRNEAKKVGVNDRAQNRKDEKLAKSQESRKRRVNAQRTGTAADWTEVDGELLRKAAGAVAKGGGAIRLGYTRDGGAYSVGFYGDGDPFTEYVSPNDDINEFLRGVIEDYGER